MKIFILGATGYIGGAVAHALYAAGHHIFATGRADDSVAALRERGFTAERASFDDIGAIERLAREADAVINAASADAAGPVDVFLRALAGTGKRLIHTSGSSVVARDTAGGPSADVFDETTPFEPIPEKRARVALDRRVLAAAERGVHAIVICPTMVYGRGRGLHPDSIQVPLLIEYAKETGTARYIGRGDNVWSNVHIDDLVDLYLLALERAPAGTFLYAENGEAALRDVAAAIGKRFGLPLGSMSIEEAEARWGIEGGRLGLASNSRVRSVRARSLGWQPHGAALAEVILAS